MLIKYDDYITGREIARKRDSDLIPYHKQNPCLYLYFVTIRFDIFTSIDKTLQNHKRCFVGYELKLVLRSSSLLSSVSLLTLTVVRLPPPPPLLLLLFVNSISRAKQNPFESTKQPSKRIKRYFMLQKKRSSKK